MRAPNRRHPEFRKTFDRVRNNARNDADRISLLKNIYAEASA
jgi:hypothetical protein